MITISEELLLFLKVISWFIIAPIVTLIWVDIITGINSKKYTFKFKKR
ncbi:MAG: hypothetical protein NDI62_00430 [Burkholderiales bacterium]|nr:hypothetical protein [Burkholderiales bacterium]